jgi:hypothetical protein
MQQPGILQPAEADSTSIGRRRFTETSATESPSKIQTTHWRCRAGAARRPCFAGRGLGLALRRRYAGRTPHCTRTIPGVCGLPVPHGA